MGPGNKFFTLGVDLLKAGLLMLFCWAIQVWFFCLNKEFQFPAASLALSPALNSFFN